MESPITVGPTPSSRGISNFKEEWISPFKQLRINKAEHKLEEYKDPQAMYKAQGSNVSSLVLIGKPVEMINWDPHERRDRLTERLKQIRGEWYEY